MKPIQILEARSESDYQTARSLFEEYARTVGADLCFQGFAEELTKLPEMYGPPQGHLLLAWRDGRAVGCVGLRTIEPGVCEMKRLYVRPEARGIGLGRQLAAAIVERGRLGGYRTMVLDTLRSMVEARVIYRSLGFVQRPAYYANPLPDVAYMELRL
ncbi:MAG: GNAT family N-acetyltransferase [Gemmatimonadales bacterium]